MRRGSGSLGVFQTRQRRPAITNAGWWYDDRVPERPASPNAKHHDAQLQPIVTDAPDRDQQQNPTISDLHGEDPGRIGHREVPRAMRVVGFPPRCRVRRACRIRPDAGVGFGGATHHGSSWLSKDSTALMFRVPGVLRAWHLQQTLLAWWLGGGSPAWDVAQTEPRSAANRGGPRECVCGVCSCNMGHTASIRGEPRAAGAPRSRPHCRADQSDAGPAASGRKSTRRSKDTFPASDPPSPDARPRPQPAPDQTASRFAELRAAALNLRSFGPPKHKPHRGVGRVPNSIRIIEEEAGVTGDESGLHAWPDACPGRLSPGEGRHCRCPPREPFVRTAVQLFLGGGGLEDEGVGRMPLWENEGLLMVSVQPWAKRADKSRWELRTGPCSGSFRPVVGDFPTAT